MQSKAFFGPDTWFYLLWVLQSFCQVGEQRCWWQSRESRERRGKNKLNTGRKLSVNCINCLQSLETEVSDFGYGNGTKKCRILQLCPTMHPKPKPQKNTLPTEAVSNYISHTGSACFCLLLLFHLCKQSISFLWPLSERPNRENNSFWRGKFNAVIALSIQMMSLIARRKIE